MSLTAAISLVIQFFRDNFYCGFSLKLEPAPLRIVEVKTLNTHLREAWE